MLKLPKEEMMNYLIESSLLLFGFAILFHLLLAKDNGYHFNRIYLLGSMVVALLLPLLEWSSPLVIETDSDWILPPISQEPELQEQAKGYSFYTLGTALLFWGYWIGVGWKGCAFGRQLRGIIRNIRGGQQIDQQAYKLVLLPGQVPIHSFGSYVFVAQSDYKDGKIEEALLQHELAHIRQRHTWDILGLELLAIFFWFHPMLQYFRSAIKLNHEHLSDQAVIRLGVDVIYYQQLLLKNICTYQTNPLASPLHFSFTKKRFQMMPKHLKATEGRWKRWMILPMTLLFVLATNISLTGQDEVKEVPPPPPPVKKESFDRPPPPPPVEVFTEKKPSKQQLLDWQNVATYGVWLDNKWLDNEKLKEMKPAAIGWFNVSKLLKNAKNYGKYTYQVNLYSQAYFEKHLKNKRGPLIREVKKDSSEE